MNPTTTHPPGTPPPPTPPPTPTRPGGPTHPGKTEATGPQPDPHLPPGAPHPDAPPSPSPRPGRPVMVVGEHRIELRRAGKPVVVAHATAHGWHVPLGVRADPYPYLRRSPANHDELAVKPRYRRRWVTVADRGEAVDLLGRVA